LDGALRKILESRTSGFGAVSLTKSYQDREFKYSVLIRRDTPQYRNLRIGQKVSFACTLTDLRSAAATCVGNEISLETAMLRCASGHEYAPSAGYRFCPNDGLPLK
jgi:hypothetical protein